MVQWTWYLKPPSEHWLKMMERKKRESKNIVLQGHRATKM
jgi:hypothetical protein